MRQRVKSAYTATLAVIAAAAPPSAVGLETIAPLVRAQHSADCICRAEGRTYAVGESACLRTAAGARVAQCGMVLNNTSWEFTERSCPDS